MGRWMWLGRGQAAWRGISLEASKELCEGVQRCIEAGLYGDGASDPENTTHVEQSRLCFTTDEGSCVLDDTRYNLDRNRSFLT